MMSSPLESTLDELTEIQRRAVDWNSGPILVLAGPGSGKTRVLTCRIARLLESSRDERFRILALTFTNKAASEMSRRVTALVPGLEGRTSIDTFHGFCAQVLRQHGVHLGIKPDFAIYSLTADRQAVLEDALGRDHAHDPNPDDMRLLPWVDRLKLRLVAPQEAEQWMLATNRVPAAVACRVAHAYRRYEEKLRDLNALDFNSLIFEAYRLFGYPALARQYQRSYRYWLIDEFQDTNGAQYALLRRMAGQDFRDVFAVADDNQTIYEWNGASVSRISDLVRDFSCGVVQLPTNFRCPPRIVEAANRLVVYNSSRAQAKQPARAARTDTSVSDDEQIRVREFSSDTDEATGIAGEIERLDLEARDGAAVLARNRALLELTHGALADRGVRAEIVTRRDDFASPQMRWLVACLRQINRPLDRRNMAVVLRTFDSFATSAPDREEVESRSESDGTNLLEAWVTSVREAEASQSATAAVDVLATLAAGHIKLPAAIQKILEHFEGDDPDDNLKDDLSAWRRISRDIRASGGLASLDRLLQELQLRTKESVPAPGTVRLTTIHGAKGLEFDTVYLIGLAEQILPSWHSVQKGGASAALEEERRECFFAITRTKTRLVLSWAHRYRGYQKAPSRFLQEMGCLASHGQDNGVRKMG